MAYADEQIVNPRTGQAMIFHQTPRDSDGSLVRVKSINPRSGQERSAEVFTGTPNLSIRSEARVACRVTRGQ